MKRSELYRYMASNEDNGLDPLDGIEYPEGKTLFDLIYNPELAEVKPRTHKVNGFEVPAPMVEAGDYWLTNIDYPEDVASITWDGDDIDHYRLKYSLCFATKEHAELNRKAQLKINPYGEGE